MSRNERSACQIKNTKSMDQQEKDKDKDHHSDQMNPNSQACRERMDDQANQGNPTSQAHQAAVDNRANQLNPNNPAYQSGRQESETEPKRKEWLSYVVS